MSKKKINELSSASKFVSAFFDGIKTNTANRFLQNAKNQGIPKPILDKLEKINKERKELDDIISKYSK